MGKNHRHKKRVKSERSKTQLKAAAATKFLPKGKNVTNTEFKIKPIVILSQVQQTSDDGHRILELKDVLSRLKHYNENLQVQACKDMEYMIKNNKTKLRTYKPEVISSIAPFIQTKMPQARKAGLSLINTFLHSFSADEIEIHFYYFSIHLRCAMTHINRNIQEDSVKFLDCFLTLVPGLMAQHAGKILPDTLMLISKLSRDSELRRTVTVTLKSKFTSFGWRLLVLSRLHTFVEAIISQLKPPERNIEQELEKITVDYSVCNQRAIYKSIAEVFCNPRYRKSESAWEELSNEPSVSEQLQMIFPILIDTWLEGGPVKGPSGEITYLTEETSMLLGCITRIFKMIWSYINSIDENKGHLRNSDGDKFITHLMKDFPFALVNRPKFQDKPDKFLSMFVSTDMKCTQENLLICHLYFIIHCNNPSRAKQADIDSIVSYITGCLSKDFSGSKLNLNTLMLILEHLLVDKITLWRRNKVPVDLLLENAIVLYTKGNLSQNNKYVLLKILTRVTLDEAMRMSLFVQGNQHYKLWLENLPDLLLAKNIRESVIKLLYDISRTGNTAFMKGFLEQFLSILEHLPNLEVTDSKDPKKAKELVIRMLCYAPDNSLEWLKDVSHRNSPYWPFIENILIQSR